MKVIQVWNNKSGKSVMPELWNVHVGKKQVISQYCCGLCCIVSDWLCVRSIPVKSVTAEREPGCQIRRDCSLSDLSGGKFLFIMDLRPHCWALRNRNLKRILCREETGRVMEVTQRVRPLCWGSWRDSGLGALSKPNTLPAPTQTALSCFQSRNGDGGKAGKCALRDRPVCHDLL